MGKFLVQPFEAVEDFLSRHFDIDFRESREQILERPDVKTAGIAQRRIPYFLSRLTKKPEPVGLPVAAGRLPVGAENLRLAGE